MLRISCCKNRPCQHLSASSDPRQHRNHHASSKVKPGRQRQPMVSTESFVVVAPDSHFPLANLPYGIFSVPGGTDTSASGSGSIKRHDYRVGCAIGEYVLDLAELHHDGVFKGTTLEGTDVFHQDTLNDFMALGRSAWKEARAVISGLLRADNPVLRDNQDLRERCLIAMDSVNMSLPARIGDYTDFFVSKYHAENCSLVMRGEKSLQPNWLHMPIGYHGRASSVVVSGTDVTRPRGQFKTADGKPAEGPSRRMDFELEMACLIGPGNNLGTSIKAEDAEEHIFGLVLMNDWSARDIQGWEYVPLGPFNGKNFATSISPWVVTLEALEPFRCPPPTREAELLPYLEIGKETTYDIRLQVSVTPESQAEPATVTNSNFRHLYFTLPQLVAHHTHGGCNLRPGDLLGTGTISGDTDDSLGCLLEQSMGGKRSVDLGGGVCRTFLEDGDRVTLSGFCQGDGFCVGFGECTGKLLPARPE